MNLAEAGPDGRGDLPLSVVVIAENEADNIAACLESVIAAASAAVETFEVILVDSASTDATVDIASDYPVTLLRIPEEAVVSCGAGRYVGDQVARGDLVLHVDGDMRLTETWLAEAVDHLRTHPDVAAAEGWLNESESDRVMSVRKVGGVMCYDADALASVGGFDPFLHGYEDVELGFRLTAAGHRLVRLPSVSADHPDVDVTEPFRRWRAGFPFAAGQSIRKSLGRPTILRMLVARQRYKLLVLGWLGLGALSLSATPLLVGWVMASVLAFGLLARGRGVSTAVRLCLAKTFGLAGLLYGLTLDTPPAEEFPLSSVTVLREGEVITGTRRQDVEDSV